jgi:hypothetical protein
VWTRLGSPFGLHGFIAGTSVALVIIVAGSLLAGASDRKENGTG